jgi:ribonuclease BN (tRNA processing enzyme)
VAIHHQVLGQPGRDNALFVEINTGQSIHNFVFDCGEACLRDLSVAQIQAIDGLFFSHFHIDHVAGFDSFLRSNYDRGVGPVRVWGPAGATEIIHHRLQGITWNLAMLQGCTTIVCENNFRNAEQELAQRTLHMISADVARLAARVKPRKLILFHLSDRYTHAGWQEQLGEVRAVFPETYFPESWNNLKDEGRRFPPVDGSSYFAAKPARVFL